LEDRVDEEEKRVVVDMREMISKEWYNIKINQKLSFYYFLFIEEPNDA
jgi:hypothetical protein